MKTVVSGALLLCSLTLSPAFASVLTFLNTPATPVDTVVWGQLGSDGTAISKNFTATSALGVSVSGTLAGLAGLTSVVCPAVNPVNCSWAAQPSGYAAGDTLIWAEDANNAGAGPVTLAFAAQFGIGAYIQATAAGQFAAKLDVYNGASLLGTHAYTSDAGGDPLFLGALDDTKEITKAVFSVTSCGSFACDPTDFSMDTLQIYGAAATVPEPATFWLAGALAALGVIVIQRRERKRAQ